jgi:hypothetical protein
MELELYCYPRLSQPGTQCTCLLSRHNHEKECGHQAVVECDCGAWCGCNECVTVCYYAFELASLEGVDHCPNDDG